MKKVIFGLLWAVIFFVLGYLTSDQPIVPKVFYFLSSIMILGVGFSVKVPEKLRSLQGAVGFFAFGILNNLVFNVPYLTNVFYILSGVMILHLILVLTGRIDHKK